MGPAAVTPLLQVRSLGIRIGEAEPVNSVSFDVMASEMLGIVGESGSGKSLTLRALLQLLPSHAATSGRALWQGRDLLTQDEPGIRAIRGREIAMIYQEPMTVLDPVLPIGLQITESLQVHLGLRGTVAGKRAIQLFDLVGIPDARRRLDNYPHEFSGGMRQRAMIAIALAAQPKLLLADEPTTALDVTIQDQILTLLVRLKDDLQMSVILVTHDLGIVAGTCDRVAVIYAGHIMESGPVHTVFTQPAHAYTLGLMRSVPARAQARQRQDFIPGTPPDPHNMPPGCRFAPRCGFASDACAATPPPLSNIGPAHQSACLHADDVTQARQTAA